MASTKNPGRVAGLWYLSLVVLGPVRLMYIPQKLFVHGNAAATVNNIAGHEWLFRFGIVDILACALVLVMLTMAFYRVFAGVDRHLAILVVIFGGVMPAIIDFVNVVSDFGVLMVLRNTELVSVFDPPQRDAIAMMFLRLGDYQNIAAEILWGIWLLPLATLVYKSRFLPRFLGVWLAINGVAYVIVSLTGTLLPEHQEKVFNLSFPALLGEIALMLWLVVRGVKAEEANGPGLRAAPAPA